MQPNQTRRVSRRALLAATAGLAFYRPANAATVSDTTTSATPLHTLARKRGLRFGTAVNTNIFTDPAYAALVKRECGILVAENHFKWGMIRPSAATLESSVADRIVAFAERQDMPVRGHALFFQQALPEWVEDRISAVSAETVLENHIRRVCAHFGTKVSSWDVLNEVVLVEDGRPDGLRKNIFLEKMGPGYIEFAFRVAKQAAPHAELVYNDWVGPYGGSYYTARRAKLLALLEYLVKRDVPIDAFGVQGHLKAWHTDFDEKAWTAFLRNVSDLGLRLHVTELDAADQRLPPDRKIRDRLVADATRQFLEPTLDNRAVRDLLTWGLSDRYTAVGLYMPRFDGLPPRSLPYDENYQAKPMRRAIARALSTAPNR